MRWQGAVTDREPLWRSAAVALRHLGRDDDAERLLFAAALGAVRRGDLLNAVDAARRLEAMNQRSDRIWAGIEEALKRRRFSAYAPSFELTESPTSLEARGDDRLCADLVALVERESRAPEQPSLQRTPLLEALGEAALPWLRELQLRVVADGSPLLGPEDGCGWVLSGALESPEGGTLPRGTLLMAAEGVERRARGLSRLLVLRREQAQELQRLAPVRAAQRLAERRRALVAALQASPFFAALSPASASRLLETARGVVVNGERIIHKNTHAAGMFVVVTGAVRVVDAEGSLSVLVAELGPGEIFGEFDVVTGQGTTCHVDAVDDVTLLTLDPGAVRSVLADDAPARDWIQRHALERRRQIEQLDTGDVVLLDE